MEQVVANCHAVYDIATYKKRRVCVTIKKYSVNKPPYVQFQLFTAKDNADLKQVSYVNYTLCKIIVIFFRSKLFFRTEVSISSLNQRVKL